MKRFRVHFTDPKTGSDEMDELDAQLYISNDDGVHFLMEDGREITYDAHEVWWIEESLL